MLPRIRSLTLNLAVALASVIVAIACVEGALRLFPELLPPATRMRVHWMEQRGVESLADPYLGYIYPPHYAAEGGAGEATFRFTIDEHGFRNPSPWPSTAEVVVVGDSEVFGYGVADDSTVASVLARGLPRSRLINLGLPGMGPEQYMRAYRRYGIPLHPRVLLFALFPGNDLQDQAEFTAWLEAGAPGNIGDWKFSRGVPPGRVEALLQHTYLFWLVRGVSRDVESSSEPPQVFPDGSRIRFAPSLLRSEASMARPGNKAFERVLEVIGQTRMLALENGTELLVLLLPTKEGVYLPLRGEEPPQVLQPFAKALGERGIAFLDLTGPLQEEARRGRRLFFEVDGHPNAAGYRIIAEAVLRHLEQNAERYGLVDWSR